MTTLATEFGTGQVLWSMFYFFLFFICVYLMVVVFADIFRSQDLSGWGKAMWSILVLFFPYLGVFVYLIARGGKMQEHAVQAAEMQDAAARAYIRDAAATGPAEQLQRLADLRSQGVIDDVEFQRLKAKIAS